ncbi:hypothetical protein B9Z55_014699 [Caenorhabditis nigoni]|nr:hypothetical protein B9Z55_014699 [Caenorhabditis nigoni]
MPEMPEEAIEMNDLKDTPSDHRKKIMEIIKVYEDRYKVFAQMNIKDMQIFDKIRTILSIDLSIEIGENISIDFIIFVRFSEQLFENDYYSFSMILAAFYRQKYALDIPKGEVPSSFVPYQEKDFLSECQHPLHTVLVMCFAAHEMKKMVLKDDFGQTLLQEKYESLKEQLEEIACSIVNNFYSNSMHGMIQIREALQADYKSEFPETERQMTPYEEYLFKKFDKSKESMTVAYKAKAMKFLSQKPCLDFMRVRNKCRKVDSATCEEHKKPYKIRMRMININNKKLWVSISTKLWFHAFFRGVYIAMFAYMLCKFPVYDDLDMTAEREWKEKIPYFYVLLVLIAQVSMTIFKATDYLNFHAFKSTRAPRTEDPKNRFEWINKNLNLLRPYFKSNRLALFRIFLVVPLLLLEAIQFVIFTLKRNKALKADEKFWYGAWVLVPIVLELLYCSLFAIATVSSLRFFHFVQSLGFFVHLFKKMWKTVGMFVLIFCTFWFVLAVIHVSISRTFMSSTNTIFYTVTSQGKFEIFGEVQDDDRVGNILDCGHFNRTVLDFFDMDYIEASCLFRSSVMPFLVFIYIFVTGVLLVNLLTAQLTKEYEKESEKSRYYKGYLKYEQLAKIESKLYLPPPLSLIYICIRLTFAVFTGICSFINLVTSRCGCPCLFPKTSRFFYMTIISKLEGYPWGAVRDSRDDHGTEKAIQDYLKKSPDDIWEKLKEVVNKYDRKLLDVDDLKNLKKDIDTFLDDQVEEERARSHSAIGTARGFTSRASSILMNRNSTIRSLEDDPSSEMNILTFA